MYMGRDGAAGHHYTWFDGQSDMQLQTTLMERDLGIIVNNKLE